MSLKKIVGTLCLGIGLVLGGNALAHATFSYEAVQLQYSIGADLEIFGIDTAAYNLNKGRPELNFGNSHAQFRNNRNSVFVWYTNPKTNLNEILTKINDLNGDGIVDVVKINDLKPSFEEGEPIYRIDNVPGPECVIRGPYKERMGADYMSPYEAEYAPKKIVSDKAGIEPYQKVFDTFKEAVQRDLSINIPE